MAASKPTPATGWGDDELVTLPSGKRARLRKKAQMVAVLRDGAITLEMLHDWQLAQEGKLDDPARAMALQDGIVAWLFLEPRCVMNGSVPEGAIHISQLDDDDLDFLIARAFGGTSEGEAFQAAGLPEDPGGAASGDDGEGVGSEPEPAAGAGAGKRPGVPRRQQSRRAPARSGKQRPKQ